MTILVKDILGLKSVDVQASLYVTAGYSLTVQYSSILLDSEVEAFVEEGTIHAFRETHRNDMLQDPITCQTP